MLNDLVTEEGATALHSLIIAVCFDDIRFICTLLEHGAHVNSATASTYQTPLHILANYVNGDSHTFRGIAWMTRGRNVGWLDIAGIYLNRATGTHDKGT